MLDTVMIGNAIVDVIVNAEDDFLVKSGIEKGGMRLVDAETAEGFYGQIGPGREISGGSAANSAVGMAAMGDRVHFIGRVSDDTLGHVFIHDIRASDVAYTTEQDEHGASTGCCLILVTPDGERTMTTFLGAAQELDEQDIDPAVVSAASITYLEGYLWDPERPRAAMLRARDIARSADKRVAFTLSDSFCVARHKKDFRTLVEGGVDIIFANESEFMALYDGQDIQQAAQHCRDMLDILVVTRGVKGAVIFQGKDVFEVPAEHVAHVIDTTGAGDLFAAGFLHGLIHGHALDECARIGSIAAAEIISHYGARPETDLKKLIAARA